MDNYLNLCKITKTVDSTKLIIGILIVVFFVVKTIIGDAKKEKEKKIAQKKVARPKTVFPPFFYDDNNEDENTNIKSPQCKQQDVPADESPNLMVDIEEEQPVCAERWRQAIIDSEILKTKF